MNQSLNLKFISLVVIVGMSMFLFTMGSSEAIQYVTSGKQLPENTVIASVNVSEQGRDEAIKTISERVEEWKENHPVIIKLDGKNLTTDSGMIRFDIESTVDEAMETKVRDLHVTLDESYVTNLKSQMNDTLAAEFSDEHFIETVKTDAAQLIDSPLEYAAYHFVGKNADSLYESIGEQTVSAPKETNTDRAVELFDGIDVENGATFSFNRVLREDRVYDEVALDVLATAIYGASIKAGMMIQERHISHRLPDYAEIGFEANVDHRQNRDLKVYNPFSGDYHLSVKVKDGKVKAQWVGYPTTSGFYVKIADQQKISPKTIIRYSSLVDNASYNLLQEGKEGEVVSVYRIDHSLQEGVQEFISEDYYPPVSRVEEHPPGSEDQAERSNNGQINEDTDQNESGSGMENNDDADEQGGDSKAPGSNSENAESDVWEEEPDGESK